MKHHHSGSYIVDTVTAQLRVLRYYGLERNSVIDMITRLFSKSIAIILILSIITQSCGNNSAKKSLECSSYIESFPHFVKLSDPIDLKYELTGVRDIFIDKDILFVSRRSGEGFIHALNKETGESLGSFLYGGNGPGELLSPPFFSMSSLYGEDNHPVFNFYNGRGKIISVDFASSLEKKNTTVISTTDIEEEGFLMHVIALPGTDDYVYCTTTVAKMTGIERFIHTPHGRITPPVMEKLNNKRIQTENDGFLFNLVGTHVGYCPNKKRIVESSLYLNSINIYDIEDGYSKTLYQGERPISIEKAEEGGVAGMKQINLCMKTYPDFFAVLSDNTHLENGGKGYGIYVYDWEGQPIMGIQIENEVTTFEFDVFSGSLFVYNSSTETLKKYDAAEIKDIVRTSRRY